MPEKASSVARVINARTQIENKRSPSSLTISDIAAWRSDEGSGGSTAVPFGVGVD